MLYAAATMWLMLIVLLAWGVHHLWSGVAKPKVVNSILLPGTLVAQLGHVFGLLITGGTVNNMALMTDDESGAPQTPADPKPRVPVIGPILVALLPMVALGCAIYAAVSWIGAPIMRHMPIEPYVPPELPASVAAFWGQLRNLITLCERTVEAIRQVQLLEWRNGLFIYLLICMSVRMAPLPGNLRGHLGAVLLTGVLAAVLGSVFPSVPQSLAGSWPVVTLTVATLMLLLMASLLIRGLIGLGQMLAKG